MATTVAESIPDGIEREYSIRGAREVARSLRRHRGLADLLIDTRIYLRTYFGDDPVVLEVVTDPDEPSAPELFATVRTQRSSGDALRLSRRFDRDWWLDALGRTAAPVVVGIEHTT